MAGTELAKAYVQIVPSAEGIRGKLSNALSGEASVAGDSAGRIAGNSLASKIKGVIAAAGIGTALKSALSEGANLQQSLGGIETLFKDSADKVIANAKNAYITAGLSANDYMESVTSFSASLLQGLAGDTNKAADVADMALTDMSDNANKMGTSMELIQNAYQGFAKQNYTMLDNLKLGYGGTKTEMQRLLADAQELTGVKYDLDNLSDVYEAIHVIQNEMGITGTTAKEAASTFSGSLASMKSAFSNLLGNLTLGEDIGPSLNALGDTVFTFVKDNLLPMVGNILSSLPEAINGAFSIAIQGLNIAANNADVFVQNGIALVTELGTGIISALPYLAEAAINIVQSLGTAIINTDWLSVAQNVLNMLKENLDLAAIEILGTDLGVMEAFFWGIQEAFIIMWDACNTIWTTIGQPIWEAIQFAIGQVQEIFAQYMPAIMVFFQTAVTGMKDSWNNHLKPALEAIGNFLNTVLKPIFQFVFDTFIRPLVKNTFEAIRNLWNGTLKPVFDNVCDFLKNVFTGNWRNAFQNILNIVTSIFSGICNLISSKMEFAKNVVNTAINKIKGFFNFSWSLPHLKMPHPSVSGSFSLNPPSVPHFSIDWYAKAMNSPMIMNSPTAFGINSLGQIMAGGEKGSEVVSGTETLMRMIATAVASQNQGVIDALQKLLELLLLYLPQLANMQLVTDTGVLIGELVQGMDVALGELATREDRGI